MNLDQSLRSTFMALSSLDLAVIEQAAKMIAVAATNDRKIMICGNGGSAADAHHFAAELVGRYRRNDRRPLPAMALSGDPAITTAISNDFGFEHVFDKQIQALGQPGDCLVAISTSGESANVHHAIMRAQYVGMRVIMMTGRSGAVAWRPLWSVNRPAPIVIDCDSDDTPRIQEAHAFAIHAICELLDELIQ